MKRNWPGQVRPTIEDDDEDEDDPIVGCQQQPCNSPSNFEAFEAIFKARFARLVIRSFRSFRS